MAVSQDGQPVQDSQQSSNKTKAIIISVSVVGGVLLIMAVVIFFVCKRYRRRHVKVPTYDPELASKRRSQAHSRGLDSVDYTSHRPLLSDDSRPRSSLNNMELDTLPRPPSATRFVDTQNVAPAGDGIPSLQLEYTSIPLYDPPPQADGLLPLPTGFTSTPSVASSTETIVAQDNTHLGVHPNEEERSADSHTTSIMSLPNPFVTSPAPSSTGVESGSLSRGTTESSGIITIQPLGVPLSQSPTELSTPIPLPQPTREPSTDVTSPVEILPVPTPVKRHPVSLLPSAVRSVPTPTIPPPPPPASRPASLRASIIGPRPLPQAPSQPTDLARARTRSQSMDMRVALLAHTASINKRQTLPSRDATSEDSASVYSQSSAGVTEWAELSNPHDQVMSGREQSVARLASSRPRPKRSWTAETTTSSSYSSRSSNSRERLGTLPSLAEDAEPGSAAVTMRLALAQAVEAARRDSVYHADSPSQPLYYPTPSPSSVSGVSGISDDLAKFENDMHSWLASPRVTSPIATTGAV